MGSSEPTMNVGNKRNATDSMGPQVREEGEPQDPSEEESESSSYLIVDGNQDENPTCHRLAQNTGPWYCSTVCIFLRKYSK